METPLQHLQDKDFLQANKVTILILVETPLQHDELLKQLKQLKVTILILVETPLQQEVEAIISKGTSSHNPYFSGNSFATVYIQNGY